MDQRELSLGDAHSRRKFMKRMTAAGLGAAAIALLDGKFAKAAGEIRPLNAGGHHQAGATTAQFPGIPGRNVNELVINFALTLEYLEADLYRQALNKASGLSLSTALMGAPTDYSRTIARTHFPEALEAAAYNYLADFAFIEAAHRDYLIALLTSLGAPQVTANPGGYAFPNGIPDTLQGIIGSIITLEETGVRAYLGALPFIDNLTYAQVAAEIYSTEARHSAALHYVIGQDPGPAPLAGDQKVVSSYPAPNTFEYFLSPFTVINTVAAFMVS